MAIYNGTTGDDTYGGTEDNDTASGGDGNDTFSAGAGNDSLDGGNGNDWLYGGDGADTMAGGVGRDFYTVDNDGDQIIEGLNEGVDWVYSYISYTLGANVDWLTLLGEADLNGTGNDITNVIQGNSGNNILDGGGFADTLVGGKGNDTYYVDHDFDRVIEYANEGIDLIYSSVSCGLNLIGIGYIENVTLTGSANINASGNSLANVLTGNSGNNLIYGGVGADTMIGGGGNDSYSVENSGDWITEDLNGGTDFVSSNISYTLAVNVENLTLTGDEHINGYGNASHNVIRGNYRDNLLDAGTGGNDILIGGLGNDSYVVDHGGVTVVERAGEGTETVYAWVNYNLVANVENLYLNGGALNGKGNGLDNVVVGNALNNHLSGEGGNDTLTGGGGQDVFVFGLGSGADVISDFSVIDHDRINVNAYSHGTSGGGGITVTQSGLDVVIDMGGDNMITVLNSLSAAVYSHIFW